MMPYKIVFEQGRRRDVTPADAPRNAPRQYEFDQIGEKVYPDGLRLPATPEEVLVWHHVVATEGQVEDLTGMLGDAKQVIELAGLDAGDVAELEAKLRDERAAATAPQEPAKTGKQKAAA